jgi:serine/threonine-protein kinase
MSPEQARGEARHLDRRTDVYSLGATLYDILSGKPPFEDESVVNIIFKVLNDDAKPLRQKLPELPEALETIVGKCLNKEAAQRYPTAQALADDLGRFLSNQRIVARQLGLLYRLRYRARRNKPVAALLIALFLGLCGFLGYGTRTYLHNLQKEREAREQKDLAKTLGQTVKDMEWMIHAAYAMPLHDTTPEKGLLRARMAEVQKDLDTRGHLAVGLGAYVLGRGHMALHEWELAYAALQRAEGQGFSDLELDYALGRVMGELYKKRLEEARKSGDKSFVEKRQQELRAEFLVPAIARLSRSRSLKSVPTKYVEALLDFYEERYDAALLNAQFAQQEQPWLYEAKQLEGDVFAARALVEKDHGDPDQAERLYEEAIHRYTQAAEGGRSDYTIYESIAETFIRQEEMDRYRGRDPRLKLERAVQAADQSLEADPRESYGWAKKASAYLFVAFFLRDQQKTAELKAITAQICELGKNGLSEHPDDPYLQDVLGNTYALIATATQVPVESTKPYFEKAMAHLNQALKLNPRFVWAYNDLATAHAQAADAAFLSPQETEGELLAAIRALSTAVSIDPGYAYAFINLSGVYEISAAIAAEHGKDPSEYVKKCVQSAEEALRMQKLVPAAFGNMALAHLYKSTWKIDKNLDASPDLQRAEENIRQLISMNPNIAQAHRDLARIHYLSARWTRQAPAIRDRSVQAGQAAAKHCLRLDAHNAECHTLMGLLLTAAALEKEPAAAFPLHQQAAREASQALSQADQEAEWLMYTASIFCEIVTYKLAHHQPAKRRDPAGLRSPSAFVAK